VQSLIQASRSTRGKLVVLAGLVVLYLVASIALVDQIIGTAAGVLVTVPLLAAALLFGLRGAILLGLGLVLLNPLLIETLTDQGWRDWITNGGGMAAGFAIVVNGAAGHFRDIAIQARDELVMRQVLEEQLVQSQKMEIVGRLAGGIAHDFNNLLTAILGYSEVGLAKIPRHEPAYGYMQNINDSAERASRLVRQLLEFSKQQVTEPKVIDTNRVLLEIDSLLRQLIGSNVELVILPAAAEGTVFMDEGQLEQIVINMAVNARDAMPEGGKIVIGTEEVTFGRPQPGFPSKIPAGKYILLSVMDTGGGMPDDVKAHIFDPFFTTKAQGTGMGQGTGLGLATCHGIVTRLGGHISVSSTIGEGTTFKVYMPYTDAQPEGTPTPSEVMLAEVPSDMGTILVVDDDALVRRFVCETLSDAGHTVIQAQNGSEALIMATGAELAGIDLLVTDVVMPLMGGKELAGRMRDEKADVRVLFMSGFPDDDIDQELHQPTTDFLQKPFTRINLMRKTQKLLAAEVTELSMV
jgi:signal transduction histidine kinase/CheY-like chemotaxis protein